MNNEEELAKMRKSIGRMKIAIAILFIVAIALGYFRFAPNDWKVMKTGSNIMRINSRTGEAYVITATGWKRIDKGKREEKKSLDEKQSQRKLYDVDYSNTSDEELAKRFDVLRNGTLKLK